MTFNNLTIKNYQSHTDTSIELGGLTVIVGASSSGKSAMVRALKALAYNQTGKDFITHGQQTCQISLSSDKGTVVLTKGKPEDSYVILPVDGEQRRYTKNGVTAPQDVSDFLGIPSKDAINFAGQFDLPFLLRSGSSGASASEVAAVLGELTNVSSIFAAARESLRLKNSYSATLKTRNADLESVERRASTFENLAALEESQRRAETYMEEALHAQTSLRRLNDLLFTLQTATNRLKAAKVNTSSELPDVTPAIELQNRLSRLDEILLALRQAKEKKELVGANISKFEQVIAAADKEYEEILHEAGTCPTCHQSTEGVHVHA